MRSWTASGHHSPPSPFFAAERASAAAQAFLAVAGSLALAQLDLETSENELMNPMSLY